MLIIWPVQTHTMTLWLRPIHSADFSLKKNRILHIPLTQLSIFCLLVGWFVSLFKWEKGIIMFFQVEEIHGDCFCSFVILGLGSNYFFHEAMLKNKHPWALVFIQIFEVDLK